jgi:hypothetical protein
MNDISRSLGNIEKQTTYGISIGLNKLAEHIRKSELESAKQEFTLRGKWYQPKNRYGFNIKYANKSYPVATVFTRADWLALHTEGGVKSSSGRLAIPTADVKRNKQDMVKRGSKPRAIKGSFLMHTQKGDAIAVRKGRGKSKKLVIMYWLEDKARIKKRFDFNKIGEKVYERNAQRYLSEGIAHAWRTAK